MSETADLDELHSFLGAGESCVLLQYFARYLRSLRAAETIVNSTARIFDLIGAVKDYSNMDRAPILEVDVPAGLDATLQMLRSRMQNIEIERDYEPDLPRISAYGGELNQVWTALIENALDALGDGVPQGQVFVRGVQDQGRLRVTAGLRPRCCWWRFGTRDRAFHPSCRSASSSRSLPPRRQAAAWDWASTMPCASCASIAGI